MLVWISIMLAAGFQISMVSTLPLQPSAAGPQAPVSAGRTKAAELVRSLLLIGGDEGASLVASARQQLTECGINDPDANMRAYVPELMR